MKRLQLKSLIKSIIKESMTTRADLDKDVMKAVNLESDDSNWENPEEKVYSDATLWVKENIKDGKYIGEHLANYGFPYKVGDSIHLEKGHVLLAMNNWNDAKKKKNENLSLGRPAGHFNESHNLVGIPTQEGDIVKVSDGSGTDSGKVGTIVKTKWKSGFGGLYRDEPGAYPTPVDKSWLSVKFDDGRVASFPANRLHGASKKTNESRVKPDYGDQLRMGMKKAYKEKNVEALAYYSSILKSDDPVASVSFEKFKGSWAYEQWIKNPMTIDKIEQFQDELKGNSYLQEIESVDSPDEEREVQIAKQILNLISNESLGIAVYGSVKLPHEKRETIRALLDELLKIHGLKEQSVSGGAGAYSTPFAFSRKKIKKSIREESDSNIRGDKNELFVEETIIESEDSFRYNVIWRGRDWKEAFETLKSHPSKNRLELWSKSHAEGPKGFAPMAFRDKNSDKVMVGNTLKMLMSSKKDPTEPKTDSLEEESTTSGVAGYSTPYAFSKNKSGSKRAIDVTKKMGYKVVGPSPRV